MSSLRLRQRLLAFIAIAAMLLGALLPGLSRALAAGEGGAPHWVEVCSAAGSYRIPVGEVEDTFLSAPDAGTDPAGSSLASDLAHCPGCCPHAGVTALPPPELPAFDCPVGAEPVPALFLLSPRPLFAWAVALARAPPLSC